MNSEQHTTAKVWLITGASRGMGHAIMEAALAAGHCVAAVSRSGEITTHIEDGAAQLLPYALDVTNTEQAVFDRMAEAVVKHFGRIDVLVNNAGHGQFTYFEESDEQQIRDVFETNLFGLMRVTRAVLPVMRRQHAGHISIFRPLRDIRVSDHPFTTRANSPLRGSPSPLRSRRNNSASGLRSSLPACSARIS